MTARVLPYGDRALLVEVPDMAAAHRLAAAMEAARQGGEAPPGIAETVVGMANLVIHLESDAPSADVQRWAAELAGDEGPVGTGPAAGRRMVEIPVTFDGVDLEEVAGALGSTPGRVVGLLTAAELTVAFLGFAPGFPYLVGLPPALAALSRRSSPRPSVPAGSVAVGGGFASVYPRATPGGWWLLGRTSTALFNADRPPYALLRPGDTVRFTEEAPGRHQDQSAPATAPRPRLRARGARTVEVVRPGLLSLVEDAGRRGVAALGVPRGGAADPDCLRLANRLVGNPDGAAAIEVTAVGPALRFTGDGYVSAVGAGPDGVDVAIDGHPVAAGAVAPVADGQVVSVGRVRHGLRAYLAVGGGFAGPSLFGSRSTDVLSGLGPRPLQAGDCLELGPPSRPRGRLSWDRTPTAVGTATVVRVIDGPHHPEGGRSVLDNDPWTVGEDSNRIGVRLTRAEAGDSPPAPEVPSTGMVNGAVQLPPDGHPIILMPDHATVGGYPVVACVISPDLALVGQLRPGDTVTLARVDRDAARRAGLEHDRRMAGMVAGWFPTRAAT